MQARNNCCYEEKLSAQFLRRVYLFDMSGICSFVFRVYDLLQNDKGDMGGLVWIREYGGCLLVITVSARLLGSAINDTYSAVWALLDAEQSWATFPLFKGKTRLDLDRCRSGGQPHSRCGLCGWTSRWLISIVIRFAL